MAFMHGMLHLLESLAPRGQRKLAGGIDSALVLAIAVDALGKDITVRGVGEGRFQLPWPQALAA